jgi:hypothetical protein
MAQVIEMIGAGEGNRTLAFTAAARPAWSPHTNRRPAYRSAELARSRSPKILANRKLAEAKGEAVCTAARGVGGGSQVPSTGRLAPSANHGHTGQVRA